ncbi:MAG: hypothetical protein E5Y03_25055 [Mesorhizobium sp.]|uniref:hypothetical protein n=1 Tax=Mesorhizobium sp. TaxID=1871066 RepID=UPI0012136B05|nr:hypothetical protein [Mesorhizobium sp.]TIN98300.1 MAG: hypothetical protein E5Y03_25055 [Mesorhizobium sp.]
MDDCAVRDEIVVLMRHGNDFVDHDRLSLSELKNVLPCIGDRLSLHVDEEGHAVYRIEARYLIDLRSSTDAREDARFWALVVDQFDEDHSDKFDDIVRAIYSEDFATIWKGSAISPASRPIETAETVDRSNRDFAYWTFERKEILRREREARLAAIKDQEGVKK